MNMKTHRNKKNPLKWIGNKILSQIYIKKKSINEINQKSKVGKS